MNDYTRIETVIRYLEKNHTAQPNLAELAATVGLSESHFHRLFRRWAGTTPKNFLQCLTLEHAKERLRESASVLDTALDAGLSGPGRLHDLFVTIDAVSPGEFKNSGTGLHIGWGLSESPFGDCVIAWSERGICHLEFLANGKQSDLPPDSLLHDWSKATFTREDHEAAQTAAAIFSTQNPDSNDLRVFVRATPFQLKVWRALLRIPEGSISSYGAVAKSIDTPSASRAVGAACGSNRIGYLIPCHRVILESGAVRGYRWGAARKKAMLAREAVSQTASR